MSKSIIADEEGARFRMDHFTLLRNNSRGSAGGKDDVLVRVRSPVFSSIFDEA